MRKEPGSVAVINNISIVNLYYIFILMAQSHVIDRLVLTWYSSSCEYYYKIGFYLYHSAMICLWFFDYINKLQQGNNALDNI